MMVVLNTILQGDALTVLRTLPDGIVQTCVTSPPYYGLRDYGVDDQIGLEATPEAYIARLVEVFREVRRVLRDDGTCWVNIGDSYSSGTIGRMDSYLGGEIDGRRVTMKQIEKPRSREVPAGLKPKDLIGIPWMLAFALRADGWYLRSDIIWHKPNCMPESVEDRPTKSHEYLFLLSKSERYFYDCEAVREPHAYKDKRPRTINGIASSTARYSGVNEGVSTHSRMGMHELGRNKRTVWTIASQPYSEAHFATFPPKLIEPCILAGSRPGDIVLDCFMGAGTVALVALQFNRAYLGIELNPAYIALAEKRIAEVQPVLWEVPA